MDYKKLREDAGLTLDQLAEMSGYSVSTINGLELRDEGSERLREKLEEILAGQKVGVGERVIHPNKLEFERWKKRAVDAEFKLDHLRSGMRKLLEESAGMRVSSKEVLEAGRKGFEAADKTIGHHSFQVRETSGGTVQQRPEVSPGSKKPPGKPGREGEKGDDRNA